MLVGFGAGVLVLVLAAVAILVVTHRSSAALQVTLLPLDAHPAGSFTASTATISPVTARSFAAKNRTSTSLAGGRATQDSYDPATTSGDGNGLYGSSSTRPVCDTGRLIRLVTADRDRAAAWADAMGIQPSAISATIHALTPVLLTRDTAVTLHTNHAGDDGEATAQAVLQAGTAVLVDRNAAPRVRCASGMPIGPANPAASSTATYLGHPWTAFTPGRTVTIIRTQQPVDTVSSIDIDTNQPTTANLGGTTSLDGYLVTDDTGVSVVSADGATTTRVVDHPVAKVFDDGSGGLIYQDLEPGTGTSPKTDTSKVMRLWAGAREPVVMKTAPPQRSLQLLDVGPYHGTTTALLSESLMPDVADSIPTFETLDLVDVTTMHTESIDMSTAVQDPSILMTFVNVGSLGGDRIGVDIGTADDYWLFFDGGKQIPPAPNRAYGQCYVVATDVCEGHLGAMLADETFASTNTNGPPTDVTVNVYSPDTGAVTQTVRFEGFGEQVGPVDLQRADKTLIASATSVEGATWPHAVAIDTKTWQTTQLPIAGHVIPLHAPLLRPNDEAAPATAAPESSSPTTPPSTAPPTTAPPTTVAGPSPNFQMCPFVSSPGGHTSGGPFTDVRPTRAALACEGSVVIDDLVWSDWTSSRADGTGRLGMDDCDPSCAEGSFSWAPVNVTLSDPVQTACGMFFTTIAITLTGGTVDPGFPPDFEFGPTSVHWKQPDGSGTPCSSG